jgi:hypothetical protein
MRNIYLTACAFLIGSAIQAQNLVVNPSFEQTASNCANFGGEGFRADLNDTWNNANSNVPGDSCSSPDLFSPCNEITIPGFPTVSVTAMPNNELGWQYARTGERYVGIITYSLGSNYREYIQGRTSAPLVTGQQYCVSMFVSKADKVPYATNNMGVYFSNNEYLRDACVDGSLIPVTPHLNYTCAPITDTLNWVRLQWNYVATGGEQYFVIGNFYNNANTIIQNTGPSSANLYAYYYIDDVSITAGGECCYTQITAVGPKCLSDAPVNLVAQAPIGTDCTPTLTGTWAGPRVNATTGLFTPSAAGTGTHTITYTLSCGYVTSTTIVVNACAELNVCVESNGQLTVSGGSGSYTWESRSIVQDCSGCQFGICEFCFGTIPTTEVWTAFSSSATATPPGTWPIRVSDGQGGIVTLNSTAGLPECEGASACAMSLSATNVVNDCGGATGSATVSATGATGNVTYTWNTNPAQTGATATGLAGGDYTVTAVDAASCQATLTVSIQEGGIEASAGDDVVVCKGESVTLTASGGTTFNWENGASLEQSVTFSPSETVTISVEVCSGVCCATAQVIVTVAEAPLIEIGTPAAAFCDSDAPVELTGSPAGGIFSGPGISGSTFSPSAAGVGTHEIIYTYTEYAECPYTGNVMLDVDICTAVGESALDRLSIHPNPTDGLLTVVGLSGNDVRTVMLDALGREVTLKQVRQTDTIDMTDLASGMYMLRFIALDGSSKAFRVVKN